ncbi:MAG: hypothetical protein NTY38_03850 [Acidobacteria bacterium]|nr:hypothetical protein [Acidobacteriota bacterium]
MAGESMFVLAGYSWKPASISRPGRQVEYGDALANGAGVSCGALQGLPIRTLIAIL